MTSVPLYIHSLRSPRARQSVSVMAMENDRRTAGVEEEEGDEALEFLIEASRTPGGRARLASTGALAVALRRVASDTSSALLPSLRLVRNLCAGDAVHQDAFVELGGPDRIASVLLSTPPASDVARVALQAIGNVACGGEAQRSAVWARFFPALFLAAARYRDPAVCDPLCMVLDTCCSSEGIGGWRSFARPRPDCQLFWRSSPQLAEDWAFSFGCTGHQEEWLDWLLCKVCIEEAYLSHLFQGLASPSTDNSIDAQCRYSFFTREQAFLLGMLSEYLSNRPKDVSMISSPCALEVLKVVDIASAIVDFSSRGSSDVPTGFLQLMHICAWENDIAHATEAPVDLLLSAGLLQLLLRLLGELEPPAIIRKSMTNADHFIQSSMALKVCPYKGFRRDLVSIIGNCLHGRKQVQEDIRQQNAIPLLLQQCVVDEDNPLLREWGLWSMRNLLEGNAENQHEVAQLQLQEPVNTPEIAGIGLRHENAQLVTYSNLFTDMIYK
ncbi:Spinocerebellar ataxia type 10 protein domain [Musa troglodytarum]|uniref:Spinocerebellar ataxia type 10 protein domain n=1 Tax=Musa troglodytarum TaxID=320322 RepID=A0A9E7H1K4_9LILI|nr:Spinocerebellar ataxia type 10 protein domain [Musa troglodytarum]